MRNVFLSIVLFCALAASGRQENLIRNPGFEAEPGTNRQPSGGWWLYIGKGSPQFKVDRTVAHGGIASVRLNSTDDAKSTLVSAPFAVAPGDEIRFEAWVRGENLPSRFKPTFAGITFRQPDGRIIERSYVQPELLTEAWTLISGVARAPAAATSAEMHLSYNDAPAVLWFDDVSAAITNLVSFSLVEGAKPWPGPQEIAVRVTSRAATQFHGTIQFVIGKQPGTKSILLEPRQSAEIKLPITLTGVGAHNYRLCLLDTAGKNLSALEGKFQTRAPLVLFPACPCYHASGIGNGDTRLDARVNLAPDQRKNLRLAVEVTDASGKSLSAASTDASLGEIVGLTLKLPVEAPGKFTLKTRLIDGTGKEVARAETPVQVRPRSESQVQFGPDGYLRVGGQPTFPLGIYNSGREMEMAKAGFTATHNYGITTGEANEVINPNDSQLLALLDRSWSNGLHMMVELPRKAIEKAQWAQVRRRIETFRHHPAVLCWGSEERIARGEAPLANIATVYRLVHELDPDHPLVLGDTKDVIQKLQNDRRDFFPDACMDAGIWWWYPIPLMEPDGNGLEGGQKATGLLEPPSWLTTTLSKKPLWIAIQAYQKPSRYARFPTPAEYRCQAYLSIINGVKGLFFYVGSGQKDYLGKPAGLFNKPDESHWDYVQQLAGELREMSPTILAPVPTARLTLTPPDAPVEFTLRQRQGGLWLISANKSDHPQSVRFKGSALATKDVQVLYENRRVTIQESSLADDFPPFGVHIYRLE